MTAREAAETIAAKNPGFRLAYSGDDAAVGYWRDDLSGFQMCASRLLGSDQFHAMPGILVNGQPVVPAGGWIELQPVAA